MYIINSSNETASNLCHIREDKISYRIRGKHLRITSASLHSIRIIHKDKFISKIAISINTIIIPYSVRKR